MPFDEYQNKILAIHLRELDDFRIDVLLNYDALRALPDEHLIRLLTPSGEATVGSLREGVARVRTKAIRKPDKDLAPGPAMTPKAQRSRKPKATTAAPLTWGGDDGEGETPGPQPAAKRTRKPKQAGISEDLASYERAARADIDSAHAEVDDRLLAEVGDGYTTMRALRERTGWTKSGVERGLKRLVAAGKLSSTGKRGMGGGYSLTNGAAAL